jgi:hypothetical protein
VQTGEVEPAGRSRGSDRPRGSDRSLLHPNDGVITRPSSRR